MAHAPDNFEDSNDSPFRSSTPKGPVQVELAVGVVGVDNLTAQPQDTSTDALVSTHKNMPAKKSLSLDEPSSPTQPERTAALSSPLLIRCTQMPRNAVAATGGGPNISFSPLPLSRTYSESPQTLRMNEFTSSPARSLGQVLEYAETSQATQQQREGIDQTASGHDVMSAEDPWVTHASAATGASAVHFHPQRGSHGHRARIGSGVGSSGWIGTSVPESRFSEFEVVYDDGIRKQRTFSLSTETEESSERTSSECDESERNPLLGHQDIQTPYNDHHQHGYADQRQDTDPTTPSSFGKNNVHYSSINAAEGPNRYPSLRQSNNPFAYFHDRLLDAWNRVAQLQLSLPNRRILKASLAYLLACLISFTPFFLPYIGASGHLAATSAVFFNPAKSLGRMVDAVTAGICAISFGFLVSVGSMASAVWFNNRDMYIWGHVVSVVVFGGGSTFIIAFAKAHFNRPTVNVGKFGSLTQGSCTLSHIMILVTLTKEGALSLVEFNMTRVLAITTSMVLGVVISTVISIILWPESAHEKLRQDMGKSLTSFRLLLKLLTKTFLLEADTTPFGSEPVQKLIETQVKSFSALAKSLEEAQLEFPGADIKKYEDCVKSLNTLAQYLNGLRSSCGLQYDMLKKEEQRKDDQTLRQPRSPTTGLNNSAPELGLGARRAMTMGARISSFSLIGSLVSDQDHSASADLIEFLNHVGKPMKSLALTCKITIEHLQNIFTSTDGDHSPVTRSDSRSRASHPYQRQTGYESAEVFSDSTNDVGNSHMRSVPSLGKMQINLAQAFEIFEAANSKALKRFYSQHQRRRSEAYRRPIGMTNRMSEPSLQDIASRLSNIAAGTGLGAAAGIEEPQDVLAEKAPVGEQIFLVYFFVFNLMEFSRELSHLVSCVETLVGGDEGLPLWIARNRLTWWRRIWFMITGFPRRLRKTTVENDVFENFDYPDSGIQSPDINRRHQNQSSTSRSNYESQGSNTYGTIGSRRRRNQRLFPKPNIHNTKNTLQTPVPSTFSQQWSTRLWKFLHLFRSFQVKYAAKAAFSAIVLLIPAFVDWTRPYFVQYRGEWALISMLIVMVPTVGGTNIMGIYRIMGTVFGCSMGVVVYLLFPAHPIMLPICCFIFAIPNFYLVLSSSHPRLGQVVLLAFNLVLIQTYNRRNGDGTVPPDDDGEDDDEYSGHVSSTILGNMGTLVDGNPSDPSYVSVVMTIALHRAVAVSLGVVIGVLVTSYVWPYEARVELRKGLSDLLLNISWLYNRLVSVYSANLDRVSIIPPVEPRHKGISELRDLGRTTTFQERFQTPHDASVVITTDMGIEKMNKEFMAIELSLQLQLLQLYALLEETPNEPRLKGKFPVGTYKDMLGSCQNILDRFLSMRLVITKDEWIESARRDFIIPVNKERREMVGNVLLYFYTIASALRLKTPLPPYLPPANNARIRLIQKIRQLPVVQNKVVMTEENDERYIFYYAYALVMEDVIRELERLGRWSQDLFGVITPAAEFEGWFTDDGIAPLSLPPSHLPSSATREAPLSPYYDVDQPYQYPSLREDPTSSQRRSDSQQAALELSDHSRHPDEASNPTDAQSISNYQLVQNSIVDRDGMFYFDPQDPFRDQPRNGDEEGIDNGDQTKIPTTLQGPGASQKSGRKFGSSNSLNSTASAPHGQQRQGSQVSRNNHGRQSQSSQSGRNYGTMPSNHGGNGEHRTSTHSSRSSLRGTGSSSGVQLPSTNTGSTRSLTTSVSANRLADEQSIFGEQIVQEPQQQE
ncbi:hypothetical protein BGX26_007012 [Mortierella sp. AD094]|nr:hypothetical protein BGX26_007012 [Mortierella sp. AD094]